MPTDNKKTRVAGALFKNKGKERNKKAPDILGEIALSSELLTYLIKQQRDDQALTIQIAGWKHISEGGLPYYAIVAAEPYGKRRTADSEEDSDLV